MWMTLIWTFPGKIKVMNWNKLSHGYKTIFNLYVVEGYTHKEIGEMLEINEGTSKSQLARARYLLMEMVKKSEIVKKSATIAK